MFSDKIGALKLLIITNTTTNTILHILKPVENQLVFIAKLLGYLYLKHFQLTSRNLTLKSSTCSIYTIFPEKATFLTPDTETYIYVSGDSIATSRKPCVRIMWIIFWLKASLRCVIKI